MVSVKLAPTTPLRRRRDTARDVTCGGVGCGVGPPGRHSWGGRTPNMGPELSGSDGEDIFRGEWVGVGVSFWKQEPNIISQRLK